jgi:hypothetical protein
MVEIDLDVLIVNLQDRAGKLLSLRGGECDDLAWIERLI